MTIWFYIWSIAKRAKAITLLDSGATKNFMNLGYTQWLHLPIKWLSQPWPLFNVDGSENKSGWLIFYMDLQVQTGQQTTNLRFFLSNLGEHKAILGYPWFAAFQPHVDWKRGWINTTQLPIIFSTPNAIKAVYTHRSQRYWCMLQRDQYFIGWVTFMAPIKSPPSKIPEELTSQGIQWRTISKATQSLHLGSCNWTTPGSTKFATWTAITPKPWGKSGNP